MYGSKIGMWMYDNGGGDKISKKMIAQLLEREISVVDHNINLRNAIAKNKHIIYGDDEIKLDELDLFFSYNAGEQTLYQMSMYETLARVIPTINNYNSFALTENKFQTAFFLSLNGINTPEYKLFHREDLDKFIEAIKGEDTFVFKPLDGWGGEGLKIIKNEDDLSSLIPFLNSHDIRELYVEKFINYDNTDYRIDIVDGKFVSCYGRKAAEGDWRTNVGSGGKIILKEPNDEVIQLALDACSLTGVDIGGVDIIYDRDKEKYVVVEVNGIPAFATPEQEKIGLNFNDKKIELIVDLIDRKTKK